MKPKDRTVFVMLPVIALLFLPCASAIRHVSAQQRQQPQSKCPVTKVTCPDSVEANDTLKITVEVRGGDPKVTPTYNWTVSAGSIESGQGTPNIEVSTKEIAPDATVTATVEAGGFDRACGYGSTAASCTTTVTKKAEARKLDEYGKLKPKDEDERLDKLMIELSLDTTAQSYIIAYGGRASRAGDAQKTANKAKAYLVSKRGLDAARVVIVDGGLREEPAIELWIVPSSAQPPKATPSSGVRRS
ncbi:MAG: hypothetical protein AABO57_01025 [Acidobacteriota bacterium]